MRRRNSLLTTTLLLALVTSVCATSTFAQPDHPLSGSWSLIQEKSSDVDPWRSMALTIESSDGLVTVYRDLIAGRDSRRDTLLIPADGQTLSTVVPESRKWLEQPHLGVFFDGKTRQHVSGAWLRPGIELMVKLSTTLQTSQGASPVDIIRRFVVSEDGTELTVLETRSSRPRPINLVFKRQ